MFFIGDDNNDDTNTTIIIAVAVVVCFIVVVVVTAIFYVRKMKKMTRYTARHDSYNSKQPRLLRIYIIKTHGSESQGQEEAGLRDEPVSYLQVAPL